MNAPPAPGAFAAMDERLAACFADIAATRMADMPVMNPALTVAVREVGVRILPEGPHWLAMLVTPWFMNLVLAPAGPEERRIGMKQMIRLPSGSYEALWNHEPAFGGFWSIALFSPMGDFVGQEIALATADAALAEMLAAAAPAVSRRSLFRRHGGAGGAGA